MRHHQTGPGTIGRVRPDATASYAELIEFCDQHLAYFMVPQYLSFVAELPRTPSEKAEKYKLKISATKTVTSSGTARARVSASAGKAAARLCSSVRDITLAAQHTGDVLTDIDGAVARVLIDRPHALNALSPGVIGGLRAAVAAAAAAGCAGIDIRGAGGTLSAGADLVDSEVEALMERLAGLSSSALIQMKGLYRAAMTADPATALAAERETLLRRLAEDPAAAGGLAAFAGRRAPDFSGART